MSAEDEDDGANDSGGDTVGDGEETAVDEGDGVRARLGETTDEAIDQFDEGLVDLLAWVLETETRARIYVQLRQHPDSTSDEVAAMTGLYPSTVREALAELHEEGRVQRSKRQNEGAGNNPYEYSAIPPSDLIAGLVDDVQSQLNTVFNLDGYLNGDDTGDQAVRITVEDGTGELGGAAEATEGEKAANADETTADGTETDDSGTTDPSEG